jgi:hypothetical protein
MAVRSSGAGAGDAAARAPVPRIRWTGVASCGTPVADKGRNDDRAWTGVASCGARPDWSPVAVSGVDCVRRGGAVARWRGGAVARWRGGAVARWRGGAVWRQCGGAVAASGASRASTACACGPPRVRPGGRWAAPQRATEVHVEHAVHLVRSHSSPRPSKCPEGRLATERRPPRSRGNAPPTLPQRSGTAGHGTAPLHQRLGSAQAWRRPVHRRAAQVSSRSRSLGVGSAR